MKSMDTYNLMPENEYTEIDGRKYLNPTLQVTQTEDFIDRLRANQQANNAQINMQTRNLGTNVPSNLGGLTGGTGYFTSRYQTPQTLTATQNLRTAAQAAALNQALKNEKAMWDKRYQEAYRNYQSRQNNKTNQPDTTDEDPDAPEFVDSSKTIVGTTPGVTGGYTVANIDTDAGEVIGYTGVPYGGEYITNYTSTVAPTRYTGFNTGAVPTRNYKDDSGHWVLEYDLPGGGTTAVRTLMGEELVRGDDGAYYIHNKQNNSYTYAGR